MKNKEKYNENLSFEIETICSTDYGPNKNIDDESDTSTLTITSSYII